MVLKVYKYYLHFEGDSFKGLAIPLTGGPQLCEVGYAPGFTRYSCEALEGQNSLR